MIDHYKRIRRRERRWSTSTTFADCGSSDGHGEDLVVDVTHDEQDTDLPTSRLDEMDDSNTRRMSCFFLQSNSTYGITTAGDDTSTILRRRRRSRRRSRNYVNWRYRWPRTANALLIVMVYSFSTMTMLKTFTGVSASGLPGADPIIAERWHYVDETFSCPIRVKCPQLCVKDTSECPIEMRCNNDSNNNNSTQDDVGINKPTTRQYLCPDGSCVNVPADVDIEGSDELDASNSNATSVPSFLTSLLCQDRMESPCHYVYHKLDDISSLNDNGNGVDDLLSEYSSLPLIACGRVVVDSMGICKEKYGQLYNQMIFSLSSQEESELEVDHHFGNSTESATNTTTNKHASSPRATASPVSSVSLSWTDFRYVVVYIWVTFVSLSIVIWGWYNHRWYPTPGSTKLLKVHDQFQNADNKAFTDNTASSMDMMNDASTGKRRGRRQRRRKRTKLKLELDPSRTGAVVEHQTSRLSNGSSIYTVDTAKSFNVYQRGYKMTLLGTILYGCTLITFFGWYILLAITTSLSYQDDTNDEDTILMALQTFCVIYNVGFIWNLMLYWPYSIKSIFYKRCKLSEATIVAVYYFHHHDLESEAQEEEKASKVPKAVLYLSKHITRVINRFMSLIFPGEVRDGVIRKSRNEVVQYCRVHTTITRCMESALGSTIDDDENHRYFVFLYRRYNFDRDKQLFIPGEYSIGRTFSEMLNNHRTHKIPGDSTDNDHNSKNHDNDYNGRFVVGALSQKQVLERRKLIGPNQIDMKQPTLYGMFREEISKPFYLYQFQILWIWVTIQYWYMMIANWCVILISAITISVFRYQSARVQYNLSQVTGMVHVIRQRTHHKHIRASDVSHDQNHAESSDSGLLFTPATTTLVLHQSEVVPGDIVRLQPMSAIHCDMILLQGEVIVDESALTGEATPHSKIPISDVPTSQIYGSDDGEDDVLYDPISLHKRQTLSAGTTLLEIPTASSPLSSTHAQKLQKEKGDNSGGGEADLALASSGRHTPLSSGFRFGDTDVEAIESGRCALGLVTHTASFTRKGDLLRDILAFRKHRVQYELDLPFAVLLLALYSIILWFIVFFQASNELVIAWSLGLATVANSLPPLLPISFTVPVGFSFDRLARSHVACSNSDSVLISGEVNKVFFDKTGTLTHQGLEYLSCRSANTWNRKQSDNIDHQGDEGQPSTVLEYAMASCHTLVLSSSATDSDGKNTGGTNAETQLIGNPIDRAMFIASGASIKRNQPNRSVWPDSDKLGHPAPVATITTKDGTKIEVLRRFDFDHNLMTQSVVIQLATVDNESTYVLAITKGSGEAIRDICVAESLPVNYDESIVASSRIGMYQIAVSIKVIPFDESKSTQPPTWARDEIESDMEFAGVLNFANLMREETPTVVSQLLEAGIKPVMLTGDNLFTGIYIARKSGILGEATPATLCIVDEISAELTWLTEGGHVSDRPPLLSLLYQLDQQGPVPAVVMTGEAWQLLLMKEPEYANAVAPFIRVVARCSPHDKVSVVDTFVRLGFTTMMCGDGGNDCGALKAAHVGLALSDNDASLVAPFTSLTKDIRSVLVVLREGRAAVASTLAVYKYIVLYGNITSYCQVITYWLKASFTDWMWTFLDGVWTVMFSLTLPLARPAKKLSTTRPTASLLSFETVSSICGIICINYVAMGVSLGLLYSQDWFQCRKWDAERVLVGNILLAADNYETQVVFLLVTAQCIAAAMTVNFGYEFRSLWFHNSLFLVVSVSAAIILIYITLVPSPLSCFWRANCDNTNLVRSVLDPEPTPINNSFHTTVMPETFRYSLLAIMVANGIAVAVYDFFIVNGRLRRR